VEELSFSIFDIHRFAIKLYMSHCDIVEKSTRWCCFFFCQVEIRSFRYVASVSFLASNSC